MSEFVRHKPEDLSQEELRAAEAIRRQLQELTLDGRRGSHLRPSAPYAWTDGGRIEPPKT